MPQSPVASHSDAKLSSEQSRWPKYLQWSWISERLKVIEIVVGIVVTGIMTNWISCTYQNKQLQLQELEQLGKYVDQALSENVATRQRFAHYFSTLLTSEDLRERFEIYGRDVEQQFEETNEELNRLKTLERKKEISEDQFKRLQELREEMRVAPKIITIRSFPQEAKTLSQAILSGQRFQQGQNEIVYKKIEALFQRYLKTLQELKEEELRTFQKRMESRIVRRLQEAADEGLREKFAQLDDAARKEQAGTSSSSVRTRIAAKYAPQKANAALQAIRLRGSQITSLLKTLDSEVTSAQGWFDNPTVDGQYLLAGIANMLEVLRSRQEQLSERLSELSEYLQTDSASLITGGGTIRGEGLSIKGDPVDEAVRGALEGYNKEFNQILDAAERRLERVLAAALAEMKGQISS